MPTIALKIPNSFNANMTTFLGSMGKMNAFAQQMQAQFQNSSLSLGQAHGAQTGIIGQFNKLNNQLGKIQGTFSGTVAQLLNSLGSAAKSFMRGLDSVTWFLSPAFKIVSWSVGTAFAIGRWIWDKIVQLGDLMLKEHLEAFGSLASVGGLRAYRAAFANLPDDPAFMANMGMARRNRSSNPYAMLQFLGVKQTADTADMMVQATLAAARFMKSQPKGTGLLAAERTGLTSIFSPTTLLALSEISEEELAANEKFYKDNKEKLQWTEKAREGWRSFTETNMLFSARLETIFGESLSDSNLLAGLTDLSAAIGSLFTAFMKAPVVQDFIKTSGKSLEKFAEKIKDKNILNLFSKFAHTVFNIIKYMVQSVKHLYRLFFLTTPTIGRLRLAERAGIYETPFYSSDVERQGRVESFGRIGGIGRAGRGYVSRGGGVGVTGRGGVRRGYKAGGGRLVGPSGPTPPIGVTADEWNAYRQGMADIESGGVYHKTGGASGRFSGAYQFGAAEISETAKHLGETPPTREQFLSDPAMQERYLTQYTLEHHQYLMKHSAKYAAMSPRDKLKILGYAHNQGAGGALTYLNTGRVGHDAFGTAATVYASRIQKYFDMLDRGEKFGGPSGKPVPPPTEPTALTTATGQPASVVDTQTGKVISNVGTGKVVGDLHIMEGVDPRLIDIAMSGAKYLPAGYTLHPVSGIEGRRGQSYGFHPRGLASDWQIYDPNGKPIPNRGDDYSGLYTLWVRGAYTEAIKKYPGIANQIGWGGAFATVPGGTTPDLMHIDLGGQRGSLRPGNVLNKLGPLSAEEQERALKKSGTQEETPKPAEEPKKEEPAKPKPTIIEHRGKDEVDENAHPVNRVKVDNRSDMDVVKDRQAA